MNRAERKYVHLHACICIDGHTCVHAGQELRKQACRAVENGNQMGTGIMK